MPKSFHPVELCIKKLIAIACLHTRPLKDCAGTDRGQIDLLTCVVSRWNEG